MKQFQLKVADGNMWKGTYWLEDDNSVPNGGLVLNDLRHCAYNFAKEVRVIGFWVEFESLAKIEQSNRYTVVDNYKLFYPIDKLFFEFGPVENLTEISNTLHKRVKNFKKKSKIDIYDKNLINDIKQAKKSFRVIIDELHNFSIYNYVGGIRAKYSTNVFEGTITNCEFSGFDITQTYLFSDYKNNPAHEPAGALTATRFLPLIKSKFNKNNNFNPTGDFITNVLSIRVDYRLRPLLDAFIFAEKLESKTDIIDIENSLIKPGLFESETDYILKNKPQQAGTFIDSEKAGAIQVVFGQFKPENVAFNAVEKPLIYENVTMGLHEGVPVWRDDKLGPVHGWDNIHWWGGYKDFHLPSAPGAFHAFHFHWRWGGAIKNTPEGKQEQFSRSGVPTNVLRNQRYYDLVGPLVDPKCWIQTIRFAVVKDHNYSTETTENFNDKFITTPVPDLIQDGAPIELWYSVQIHKSTILQQVLKVGKPLGGSLEVASLDGTIFIHGIFFAHESETIVPLKLPFGLKTPTELPLKIKPPEGRGSQTKEYSPDNEMKIVKERKFIRIAPFKSIGINKI